jgi:hypothetical protein
MATHDQPIEDPINPAPTPAAGLDVPTPRSVVKGATWALVILAAIVAGVGSWLATEAVLKAYKATFIKGASPYPTPEETRQYQNINIVGGSVALASTGGILGLAMGLAGGAARRSIKAALSAGAVGLLVGAVLEGGVARLVLWYAYKKIDLQAEDMIQPIALHLATWCVVGAVGGLAFGLGLGGRKRWLRTMLGGAIGAGIAIVAYDLIGAILLSTSGTHLPQADTPVARALAQILATIGTAIGSTLAANDPKKKPVAS